MEPCKNCRGIGVVGGETCLMCEGAGEMPELATDDDVRP